MNGGVHVRLEPLFIARGDPARLARAGCRAPGSTLERALAHQVETVEALACADVVVNTAPTGSGKTRAALLALASLPADASALVLAPTNALVGQHEDDARGFVREVGLPHHVVGLDAARIGRLPGEGLRRGERLVRALDDPSRLGATEPGAPLLVVTNPDIFYFATHALHAQHDRRNLQARFLSRFDLVVVDELHLYDARQLASFLLFLVLSHELGWFAARGRKVLLLTATPFPTVDALLARLAGRGVRIERVAAPEVAPGNQGAVHVLAPLDLELHPLRGELADAVAAFLPALEARLSAGEDGLIVGDRLADVNRLALRLRGTALAEHVARVTGPVSRGRRDEATRARLVLATATVDVGFNFAGRTKDRQGIDWLLAEASSHDRLWQRVGRAGRVLGRERVDHPSWAACFVPATVASSAELRALHGMTLSRSEVRQRIEAAAGERMRRAFGESYLAWWSLQEAAVSLLELDATLPAELRPYVERAFESLREVLVPGSGWHLGSALGWARELRRLERLADELVRRPLAAADMTPRLVRGWLDSQAAEPRVPTDDQLRRAGEAVVESPRYRTQVREFVEGELAVRRAILTFRGDRGADEVWVEDPDGLVTEAAVGVELDLLHVLRNAELAPRGRAFVVTGLRDQPLALRFVADRHETSQDAFERMRLGRVIALRGVRVQALLPGSDARVPVPVALEQPFGDGPVAAVVLRRTEPGLTVAAAEGLWASRLTVRLPAAPGARAALPWEAEYAVFFGTDAYRFLARIPSARAVDQPDPEPMILEEDAGAPVRGAPCQ